MCWQHEGYSELVQLHGIPHLSSGAEIESVCACSTQGIAYVPNRLATLDSSNKLIGISNNTERTTWGGIAYRNDNGALLAVQERRLSNSTGALLPQPRSKTCCLHMPRMRQAVCPCAPNCGMRHAYILHCIIAQHL